MAALLATACWSLPAAAGDFTVLHAFGSGKDGSQLSSRMVMGPAGALYGTSVFGGTKGGGTVFRLTPPSDGAGAWTEDILFNFADVNAIGISATGTQPRSALWFNDDGSLSGTTSWGGRGAGNVFKMSPPAAGTGDWKESMVHTFESGADDAGFPEGMPIPVNASGTRIGTTVGGGPANIGAVYSMTPSIDPALPADYKLLYTFDGSEGQKPTGDLAADRAGNLYGVAFIGGASGFGTIFKLIPPKTNAQPWTEETLYSFTGGADGRAPDQKLAIDARGALWGTTASGGAALLGNIFRLSPPKTPGQPWAFTTMHTFAKRDGGTSPHSALTPDGHGGFVGTTGTGGTKDCGVVYRFRPSRHAGEEPVFTVLHSLEGGTDGSFPYGDLLLADGALYGQTYGSNEADSLPCKGASIAFKLAPRKR